jgi:hypothetical protein
MAKKPKVSGAYYYERKIAKLKNELIELAEQLEAERFICNERGAAIIALTQPQVLADWLDLWMWTDEEA